MSAATYPPPGSGYSHLVTLDAVAFEATFGKGRSTMAAAIRERHHLAGSIAPK
jgi:hypothetical protein